MGSNEKRMDQLRNGLLRAVSAQQRDPTAARLLVDAIARGVETKQLVNGGTGVRTYLAAHGIGNPTEQLLDTIEEFKKEYASVFELATALKRTAEHRAADTPADSDDEWKSQSSREDDDEEVEGQGKNLFLHRSDAEDEPDDGGDAEGDTKMEDPDAVLEHCELSVLNDFSQQILAHGETAANAKWPTIKQPAEKAQSDALCDAVMKHLDLLSSNHKASIGFFGPTGAGKTCNLNLLLAGRPDQPFLSMDSGRSVTDKTVSILFADTLSVCIVSVPDESMSDAQAVELLAPVVLSGAFSGGESKLEHVTLPLPAARKEDEALSVIGDLFTNPRTAHSVAREQLQAAKLRSAILVAGPFARVPNSSVLVDCPGLGHDKAAAAEGAAVAAGPGAGARAGARAGPGDGTSLEKAWVQRMTETLMARTDVAAVISSRRSALEVGRIKALLDRDERPQVMWCTRSCNEDDETQAARLSDAQRLVAQWSDEADNVSRARIECAHMAHDLVYVAVNLRNDPAEPQAAICQGVQLSIARWRANVAGRLRQLLIQTSEVLHAWSSDGRMQGIEQFQKDVDTTIRGALKCLPSRLLDAFGDMPKSCTTDQQVRFLRNECKEILRHLEATVIDAANQRRKPAANEAHCKPLRVLYAHRCDLRPSANDWWNARSVEVSRACEKMATDRTELRAALQTLARHLMAQADSVSDCRKLTEIPFSWRGLSTVVLAIKAPTAVRIHSSAPNDNSPLPPRLTKGHAAKEIEEPHGSPLVQTNGMRDPTRYMVDNNRTCRDGFMSVHLGPGKNVGDTTLSYPSKLTSALAGLKRGKDSDPFPVFVMALHWKKQAIALQEQEHNLVLRHFFNRKWGRSILQVHAPAVAPTLFLVTQEHQVSYMTELLRYIGRHDETLNGLIQSNVCLVPMPELNADHALQYCNLVARALQFPTYFRVSDQVKRIKWLDVMDSMLYKQMDPACSSFYHPILYLSKVAKEWTESVRKLIIQDLPRHSTTLDWNSCREDLDDYPNEDVLTSVDALEKELQWLLGNLENVQTQAVADGTLEPVVKVLQQAKATLTAALPLMHLGEISVSSDGRQDHKVRSQFTISISRVNTRTRPVGALEPEKKPSKAKKPVSTQFKDVRTVVWCNTKLIHAAIDGPTFCNALTGEDRASVEVTHTEYRKAEGQLVQSLFKLGVLSAHAWHFQAECIRKKQTNSGKLSQDTPSDSEQSTPPSPPRAVTRPTKRARNAAAGEPEE